MDQDPVDQDQDQDKDQDQDQDSQEPGGAKGNRSAPEPVGARGAGALEGPPTADRSIQVTHLVNQSINASDTTINK